MFVPEYQDPEETLDEGTMWGVNAAKFLEVS